MILVFWMDKKMDMLFLKNATCFKNIFGPISQINWYLDLKEKKIFFKNSDYL